jgi:hypothetical protein
MTPNTFRKADMRLRRSALGTTVVLAAMLSVATVSMLATAVADGPTGPYLDDVVDAWHDSPVYVDPTQRALLPDSDADLIEQRIHAHQPTIRVAVVPAVALDGMPGRSYNERGVDFLVEATSRVDEDGYYFVVFGGVGAFSGSIGDIAPAEHILGSHLDDFTRGEPAGLLNAVFDELGVPALPVAAGDTARSALPVLITVGALLVAIAAGGLLYRQSRRRRGHGPALYRPSFDVLPDEMDTLEERQRLAREDVTRFGEEISAAELPVDDTAVAADVQAAMDAYAEIGKVVDGAPDDVVLRAVRARAEYGRWRLACARARLDGSALPPRRADCFFDARHGISTADWMYSPANGVAREVPVCADCADARMGSRR